MFAGLSESRYTVKMLCLHRLRRPGAVMQPVYKPNVDMVGFCCVFATIDPRRVSLAKRIPREGLGT